MKHVITIDGPAASGKSSVSRLLSERLGWRWVSTGAFYRAIGYITKAKEVDAHDEEAVVNLINTAKMEIVLDPKKTRVILEGQDITDKIFVEEVGTYASQISSHPKVREALLKAQRDLALDSNLVAEGRDCGTVIFPKALLKIFLTADQSQRASRRVQQGGGAVEEVLKAQQKRDEADTQRKSAPLQAAQDATIIDTTHLTLEQVADQVEEQAKKLLNL